MYPDFVSISKQITHFNSTLRFVNANNSHLSYIYMSIDLVSRLTRHFLCVDKKQRQSENINL